jgi:hypothetical protein
VRDEELDIAIQETPIRLNPDRIARTLDDIEQLGNRYHGTDGEARGRDYVLERFTELGLENVRLEPFRYLAYEADRASCRHEGNELACRAVQFSADGEAEGEAAYIGTGVEADFERIDRLGIDLAGKVVIAHSIAPFMVAPFLEGREVAAFVNIGETPDELVGNFTACLYRPPLEPPWPGRPVAYPSVTIEVAVGRELISTMTTGRPVTLQVEHHARYVEKESGNVVGEIPGTGEGQVVFGGHYDSQLEGPCVWDNGTGLASTLETARVLAESRPLRTVVVVGFGVEEVGLWGSTWYTVQHADQMDHVAGMLNLDAVASAYPAKRTIWTDEAMRDFAVESATLQEWETEVVFDARQFAFSDNTPFTDAGVPACWIWEFPPIHPYYHSTGDVRSLVDPAKVAATAGVSARVAQRLATIAEPGLGRASPERAAAQTPVS